MKVKLSLLFFLVISSTYLFSQETTVPDDNFENYLETHDANGNVVAIGNVASMGNGIANDNKVTTSKISNVETLDIGNLGISDLTGITGFTALKKLNCNDNTITSLNLSGNIALEELNCYKSGLQSIDVTQNINLKIIQCFRNELTTIDFTNNTALTRIDIFQNKLTSLDISQNTALTSIGCGRNPLTSLNLSNNTELQRLSCYGNQLTSLDFTNNTKLTTVICYDNNLTSLDVTNLPLLKDLDCVNNKLTSLDLSKNPELLELQVYENNLTSLDISNNLKLVELYAESNSITSLDVSKNIALVDLSIAYNQLTYLNIRNGNNTNLDNRDFDISNNPALTCVTVDDVTHANTTLIKKDAQTEYKLFCSETNVPDDNFEAYLETHNATGGVVPIGDPNSMGNGITNDNKVATERIQNITFLNISNQGITDFTGLEDFASLQQFRGFNNTITSGNLDVTANKNLTEIVCHDMGLSSINVSGLAVLEQLNIGGNNLSTIDVSTNPKLSYFNIDRNNFTTIDVSSNTALLDLRIRENSLTTINLSNNTNLTRLYLGDNLLTALNVSKNIVLETISVGGNQLTTLNVNGLNNLTDLFVENMATFTSLDVSNNANLEDIGVSNTGLSVLDLSTNTKLIEVYANSTAITTLDFSASTNIEYIECKNAQLTTLNLKNGNNSNSIELYATGNSKLFCIQVDDPSASYLSSWEKDATANFSNDCNWTYVPDDKFENYLETHDANNNTVAVGDPTSMGNGIANDNFVKTANIENVTDLFIAFQGITDITGLEDFTALKVLFIFSNTLTNTNLNLTSNTNLTRVDAGGMGLTSINITGLTALNRIDVSRNNLTSIDVTTNTALKEFMISSNSLTSLDVSKNTLLEDLQIHETTLNTIDVSANINLTRILASLNQFTTLNTKNNVLLKQLNLSRNPFTSFDVSHLTNLEELNLNETKITSIDISKNLKLKEFSARNNNELVEVNARNGNNSSFTEFEVDGCPNLTCIEVNDPNATFLTSWLKDSTANFAEYCRFTNIPDANFETYLETHNQYGGSVALGSSNSLGNGVINDNKVPTAKIEVIQLLTPRNEGIQDFTGIEDFTSLIRFWIDNNILTNKNLDLSKNTLLQSITLENTGVISLNISNLSVLESLEAPNNSLTALDISTNTALKFLNVGNNNITNLDVSNNDLTSLTIRNNRLGTIDVSTQVNLTSLYAENTNITSLNVSNNSLLENLECGLNPLTSLDVTNLTNLFFLSFSSTSISEIDLSKNVNLSRLACDTTPLTSLDLGNQNTLDNLSCKNTLLTSLNLRSGNNTDLDNVDVTGNPNLTCISVDDTTASVLAGWLKDNTANYAEYCRLTNITDANFENYLETHDADGNIVSLGNTASLGNGIINDNKVPTRKIEKIVNLDLNRLNITDLTGIEAFAALESLNIDYNDLTTLDVSNNSKLKILNAAENDLTALNLSSNTALEEVELRSNKIRTLIVNNPNLKKLRASKNQYTYLDVTNCPKLEELSITQTLLVSLDVRNGNNNLMTDFNAKFNDSLTCIEVDDASATYLSTWEKDATASFSENCNTAVWSGANGTNWTDTGNWVSNAVATTTQNVVVPTFVTSPVINSGVTAEMNDLKIEQLSSFTVEDNGAAIVNGNFDTAETVTIKSSANTSGTLIVKGTATGMVSFERSGLEANKWSIVTVPVSGQSIKEFIENSANNIRVNTTVTPNRYAVAYYDDSRAEGSKWVYYTADDIATNTLTFEKGKGYIISRVTNGAVTFTGSLTTTDEAISVNGDQWNAIGNPYTAYLPINNNSNSNFIQENLSKFDPVNVGVYVWDNGQNKYVAKTLLDAGTSLTVGQGFFVKTASGVSSINFKENQRLSDATGVQTFSRSLGVPNVQVKAEQEGTIVDTNIKFFATATRGLDPGYDVGNFGEASFDIFSHLVENSGGKDFTIQSLPTSDYENISIPLGLRSEANKTIKISVKPEHLPEGIEVSLEDRENGRTILLNENNSYDLKTTTAISGIGRFYIHLKSKTLTTSEEVLSDRNIKIYTSGKQEVTISGITSKETVHVKIFSVLGSEIFSEKIQSSEKFIIKPSKVETGIYIVRLETEGKTIRKKVIFE